MCATSCGSIAPLADRNTGFSKSPVRLEPHRASATHEAAEKNIMADERMRDVDAPSDGWRLIIGGFSPRFEMKIGAAPDYGKCGMICSVNTFM
jgi:hypothetical protein